MDYIVVDDTLCKLASHVVAIWQRDWCLEQAIFTAP